MNMLCYINKYIYYMKKTGMTNMKSIGALFRYELHTKRSKIYSSIIQSGSR